MAPETVLHVGAENAASYTAAQIGESASVAVPAEMSAAEINIVVISGAITAKR